MKPHRINTKSFDTFAGQGQRSSWRLPRLLCAASLGASLLFALTNEALAQPPASPSDGRYEVVTKDGSRYEGQLVERVVGNHVTIKLVTGDARTFPLSDVKSDGPVGQAPATPAGMVPAGQLPAGLQVGVPPALLMSQLAALTGIPNVPLAYHGPDEVVVHITNTTNEGGKLLHESASGWELVCELPCTTTVDPKGSYKIHNSDPFQFPAGEKSLDLVADIGSHRRQAGWGLALILTGSIGGATFAPLIFSGIFDGSDEGGPLSSGAKTAGWTVIGVSSAMVVAGIVLLALPATSSLTTTGGKRIATEPMVPVVGSLALTPSGLVF